MAIPTINNLDTTHQSSQAPANGPAYRPRLYRILLGMVAVASAGYYSYSAPIYEGRISAVYEDTLPVNVGVFLESHSSEIKQLQNTKEPVSLGQWEYLGGGISKHAYAHPDLPGMVIKVPNDKGETSEDDLRLHYTNLEQIRSIAAPFDRIVLPESHLYQTSKGLILVEERLRTEGFRCGSADLFGELFGKQTVEKKVMDQFYAFTKAARLCDLRPGSNHNAGLISQSNPQKIGIIDFDCVDTPYLIGSLVLVAGVASWVGAAVFAKKISKTKPGPVVLLGLLGGGLMFLLSKDDGQFGNMMVSVGTAMPAMSFVVIALQLVATKVRDRAIEYMLS